MRNPTKFCELNLVLKSGAKLHGTFHVPIGVDNQMRPADAIRKMANDFILLCDVTVRDGSDSDTQQAILVRCDAVSYIELPPQGWSIRDVTYDAPSVANAMIQSN